MNDWIILACVLSFAAVAFASLFVAMSANKANVARAIRSDAIIADLLTKSVNSAVVMESEQIDRINAENGTATEKIPEDPFTGVVGTQPDEGWDTVGDKSATEIE